MVYSPFDDWKDQPGQKRCIMEDAIDRRSVVLGGFARDLPSCVSIARKSLPS
jgi:hypothetical protein